MFNSIMDNFASAKGAAADASSAIEELADANSIYVDSIEGKINRLNATFQSFSDNILDSGIVKFFVDFANAALSAVDAVNGLAGSIPSLIALGGVGVGAADAKSIYKNGKIDVPAYACYDSKVA